MSALKAIVNTLKRLDANPEAFRKLDRLENKAPELLDVYQNPVIANALDKASNPEVPAELALMDPEEFQNIALPMPWNLSMESTSGIPLSRLKVDALKSILHSEYPSLEVTEDPRLFSSEGGIPYFGNEERMDFLVDPGFDQMQRLEFAIPRPNIAQTTGHDGRHRAHALNELDYKNMLVQLEPSYGSRNRKGLDHLALQYLKGPNTKVYQQDTGKYSGSAADLFKILGLGGLSLLPMVEE